jgi:stearoyl-CoA desaturase (delta-9 desaturase)
MAIVLYTIFVTQLSAVFMSIYVHRSIAHKGVEFHPVVSHIIRTWLWLTEGVIIKEWAEQHRWHHKFADTPQDPHKSLKHGVVKVAWFNFWQHVVSKFSERKESRYRYSPTEDWADKNIYNKHYLLGLFLMLAIDVALFQWWGIVVWIIQMIWTPLGVSIGVNVLGHYCGYRNYNTKDKSHNFFPFGFLVGGDEFHNNHHHSPGNPKYSQRWFEFDIGWVYITLLKWIGLAKVKK